jgi:predicted 2-oxoglutarate/Fe(II)-dependent dioxygenase YbiX
MQNRPPRNQRYFQTGNRIPDFRRNDDSGGIVMLYRDLHHGQPILFLRNPSAAEFADIGRAVAAIAEASSLSVVALIPGEVTDLARFSPAAEERTTILADDGSLLEALRGSGNENPWGILTDNNLRVLARLSGPVTHRGEELRTAMRLLAPVDSLEVSGPAPVLVIPRAMETGFCDELIAEFESRGGQPSGIFVFENGKRTWRPDPNIKDRSDVYIHDGPLYERIQSELARTVLPEIQRAFHFRVNRHEPFKLICYRSESGGYFRPHRDNVSHDAWYRRFAMTINLNTGDYEGGELRFPEYGPHRYRPERGGAVVFSCSLVHEALPVTAGKRYALLSFFFDDAAEQAALRAGGKPAPQ